MSLYPIILFVHVLGAIGYCISVAMSLFAFAGMRRAQRVEQVRTLMHLADVSGPLGGLSALLLVASGFYLALTAWSLLASWILVALISLILMVPATAVLVAPRRSVLVRVMREAPDGAVPEALARRIHDPVLATVFQTVAVLLAGIIFLMTIKPNLVISIIVMLVALVVGLLLSALVARRARIKPQALASSMSYASVPVAQGEE